jgi:opacity protein-like surface antigen
MLKGTGWLSLAGLFALLAAAAAADAQTPPSSSAGAAFDGTYVGVSRTVEGAMLGDDHSNRRQVCTNTGQPGPLTVAGGVVRWPGAKAEGSVNAQGVLVMRGPEGWRFDGQIDRRGMVTGRLTSFCSYHVVWQKEGA